MNQNEKDLHIRTLLRTSEISDKYSYKTRDSMESLANALINVSVFNGALIIRNDNNIIAAVSLSLTGMVRFYNFIKDTNEVSSPELGRIIASASRSFLERVLSEEEPIVKEIFQLCSDKQHLTLKKKIKSLDFEVIVHSDSVELFEHIKDF